MGGELEQGGVKANRIARALEHGATQVVVEERPRERIEEGKGGDVTAQEVGHRRIEIKAQEQHARVGEHHDEGHQRAHGAPDAKLAEVGPVDLTLLPR